MKLIALILGFLIIFNFPVPYFYNSAIISVILSTIIYSFSSKRIVLINKLFKLLKSKYFVFTLLIYIFLVFISLFQIITLKTFDLSIIKVNILAYLIVLCIFFIYPIIDVYFLRNKDHFVEILKYIIFLFVVQSFIQIFAFLNPSIADLIHFFQKDTVSNKNYGGIRALALSGNPFFDLSSGYGLVFILYFYFLSISKTNLLLKYFFFILIILGSFFAGRTAFVGLIFGLIHYIFYNYKNIFSFLRIVLLFSFVFSIFIFLYNNLPVSYKNIVDNNLLPFVFEFIYSYDETGEFTTESTEVLRDMYFSVSWNTFLFGDGIYQNYDGSYYKYTDGGYMRNILFYGIFGTIFKMICQILIVYVPFFKSRNTDFNINFLFTILIGFIFFIHYKGDVLMTMPIIQALIVLLILSCLNKSKNA